MGEYSIQALRADVRMHLRQLQAAGLGTLGGTKRRDTLKLSPLAPGAHSLSAKALVHENFVRSEDGSLMFRDASQEFVGRLPAALVRLAEQRRTDDLEFLWPKLDKTHLRVLFAVVREMASTSAGSP